MHYEIAVNLVILLILFVLHAQRVGYYVVDVGVKGCLVEPKKKNANHHAEESVCVITFELIQVGGTQTVTIPNSCHY
jgi:hypothetical protein